MGNQLDEAVRIAITRRTGDRRLYGVIAAVDGDDLDTIFVKFAQSMTDGVPVDSLDSDTPSGVSVRAVEAITTHEKAFSRPCFQSFRQGVAEI